MFLSRLLLFLSRSAPVLQSSSIFIQAVARLLSLLRSMLAAQPWCPCSNVLPSSCNLHWEAFIILRSSQALWLLNLCGDNSNVCFAVNTSVTIGSPLAQQLLFLCFSTLFFMLSCYFASRWNIIEVGCSISCSVSRCFYLLLSCPSFWAEPLGAVLPKGGVSWCARAWVVSLHTHIKSRQIFDISLQWCSFPSR